MSCPKSLMFWVIQITHQWSSYSESQRTCRIDLCSKCRADFVGKCHALSGYVRINMESDDISDGKTVDQSLGQLADFKESMGPRAAAVNFSQGCCVFPCGALQIDATNQLLSRLALKFARCASGQTPPRKTKSCATAAQHTGHGYQLSLGFLTSLAPQEALAVQVRQVLILVRGWTNKRGIIKQAHGNHRLRPIAINPTIDHTPRFEVMGHCCAMCWCEAWLIVTSIYASLPSFTFICHNW